MRKQPTNIIAVGRIVDGEYGSPHGSGCQGAYIVHMPNNTAVLKVLCSDGIDPEAEGFEHVSVSCVDRTPTWEEMAFIKEQFWEDNEVCFQLHPSKSEYVNCHPYCLHIWRHRNFPPPLPSSYLVGPKK